MDKGYEYKRSECPECGEMIADNWYVRHMKQDHPELRDQTDDYRIRQIMEAAMNPDCERCGADNPILIPGSGAMGRPPLQLCHNCIKEMLDTRDEKLQALVTRNVRLQYALISARDIIEKVLMED